MLPEYRVAYVVVSKAACTSFKWLVAELQGEEPAQFHARTSRMVTRDMCIHHRGAFLRTPRLADLADDALEEVSTENGWFIFTLSRHPAARLFSAWQSKLLLREPRWVELHGHAPWFPRVPRSTEDVVEDFARFAEVLTDERGQWILGRRHFMPQVAEAAPDRVPYTRIYDTAEIPQLLADLEGHLRAHGWEGELRLKQSNETPLRPIARLFDEPVREAIASVFADDFRAFGYDDPLPPRLDPLDEYPAAAFEEVGRLIERHERIGDLAVAAAELAAELKQVRREAAAAVTAAATNGRPTGARALAGRLRRRISPR